MAQPAVTARSGRKPGARQWRTVESKLLLEVVELVQPAGADNWRQVLEEFEARRGHSMVRFQFLNFECLPFLI